MSYIKKLLSCGVSFCLLLSVAPITSCAAATTDANTHTIVLKSTENADGTYSHSATYDGAAIEEFDYAWHADPSEVHDDVKNCPAEYYTGTKPETDAAVYIAHDIYYYPELNADGFKKVSYDGETEWAYYYTAEGYEEYIFATLPVLGSDLPTQMMHSAEDAYQNAVLHITEAGTYIIEGDWHGQIWIDLGDSDDVFADESAKVTVILNGVDVTCTVAPALVFYSVYECDNTWEDQESWNSDVDTSNAGANVIIADDTVNNFSGTNIYRMLKATYKNSDDTSAVPVQKKARKTDAASYSYMSMNIDGEKDDTGILNITSGFEGVDSELHMSVNGGNINIYSQDDGMNVNEDGVSVLTFNGGNVHIMGGLGSEGDGIDSNGFLVVNGGTLITMANPVSDSGMDSDFGTYVNGGTVVALGSTMDWAESSDSTDSTQATMNLQFSSAQSSNEAIIVTDLDGNVIFAYDPDKDEVAGSNARSYRGAILSSPNFEIGGEYYIYVGGDVSGSESSGVYDVSTVTGFSEDAVQQCYSSTGDLGGRPGGMGGMGNKGDFQPGEMPEDFDPAQAGARPDRGENRGEKPDFDQMTPPEGDMTPPEGAEMPEGVRPGGEPWNGDLPEGMDFPDRGQMNGMAPGGVGETVFTMTKAVNSFSGVMDYDSSAAGKFIDVFETDWYYDAVSYMHEAGLIDGIGNGMFAPSQETTRGMIITILHRLEGTPAASGSASFADVASGSYCEEAVIWACENGIITGYDNGNFGPDDIITREQLATILYRYADYKGYDITSNTDLTTYDDHSAVSSYAKDAVTWANSTGLIVGTNANKLAPQGTATRSQVATVFMRLCENSLFHTEA